MLPLPGGLADDRYRRAFLSVRPASDVLSIGEAIDEVSPEADSNSCIRA